jgi:FkbM family methyltransferase
VRLRRPETLFLQNLISTRNIDTLIDVGANVGQYAMRHRILGFQGNIHSFEPAAEAFARLQAAAQDDAAWSCYGVALGSEAGEAVLRVSDDSVSSSLLPVAPAHIVAAPRSIETGRQQVPVHPLDEYRNAFGSNLWLKLDTQGFELPILLGASETLRDVQVVQTELSLVECYEGQAMYNEVLGVLHDAGFRIASVEAGTQMHDTGEMLQFDALMVRI